MSRYVAAIDAGTTSTRCMLFDRAGRLCSSAQAEIRQIYPQPGRVEHDPLDLWHTTQRVVIDALREAQATHHDLAAVGLTNQRETAVFWNRRTGEPIGNAIVWQDTRTRDLCERLAGDVGPDRFRYRTGLPLATYFSGPKIRWALDNDPALRDAAERGDAVCGTVDTWLLFNLTAGRGFVTDVTNASRTLLMNLRTLQWDDEVLDAIGVPRDMLPDIVSSADAHAFGVTDAAGPFGGEVPVTAVLGDQQAALFGQCCFAPGECKNTYGTGSFVLLNTGREPVASGHGLITTVAYRLGDEPAAYALEGSIAVTGALVQWLRDNLGFFENAADIEPLAASVDDAGGCYIVPAFSGLFAPHWRADARGVIVGLTRYVTKAHLARAALEAACYQTRDVLDAMRRDADVRIDELRVDGGMTVNNLLMQIQTDVLGLPVVRPAVAETTALGAAFAAGLAVGFYDDLDALRRQWRAEARWRPAIDRAERDRRFDGWQRAVQRSLNWAQ